MPVIFGGSCNEPKSIFDKHKACNSKVEHDKQSVDTKYAWESDDVIIPFLVIQSYREYHVENKEIDAKCAS